MELPRASTKIAKKSKELTAGPIIVCVPTFKKRNISFFKRDHNDRKFDEFINIVYLIIIFYQN